MRTKVIVILRGAVAFLRWLFSAEHLPASSAGTLGASSRQSGFARRLFAGETLAVVSCSLAGTKRRPSWLRWVLSPERLPTASDQPNAPAARPSSSWGWLFGREELTECNVECVPTHPHAALSPAGGKEFSDTDSGMKARAPRVGIYRWLLSPDVCQRLEEPPRRQSEGFWRWVLSPETCPCMEEPPRLRPKGFWHWVVSPGRL